MVSTVTLLTEREVAACTKAFQLFDRDNSGQLDLWEVKNLLVSIGMSQKDATEEELLNLINTVDEDGNGHINMEEFIMLVERQKMVEVEGDKEEQDTTTDAFVAMGGNPDKSGEVDTAKLRKAFRDFKLSVDIDKLLAEVDQDGSGYIDYEEFKALLARE